MSTPVFSLISEKRIQKLAETLHVFTGLNVCLRDAKGALLTIVGEECRYCRRLSELVFTENQCPKLYENAGKRAQRLGEAYIFSCHANLNLIAFPLTYGDELIGSVILGPFLMDNPDSTVMNYLTDASVSGARLLELYDLTTEIRVIPPKKVNQIKDLTDELLSSLMEEERRSLIQKQQNTYQQAKLGETIQVYKGTGKSFGMEEYGEKEELLLSAIKHGEREQVANRLTDIMGYLMYQQGGNINWVKHRCEELVTLMSRAAMNAGVKADTVFTLNDDFMKKMSAETNTDKLSLILKEASETFHEATLSQRDKGNPYIREALKFIDGNYGNRLTLGTVADHVSLSHSYFSTLFKETVGISFREYLCRLRLDESKRLLLSSNYSITDIAIAMGFPDQSYYCKMFKAYVGITPGKYRA